MKKLTLQSTIAEVLNNPKAVALAEKIKPGITRHPALFLVKRLTLENLAQKYSSKITKETLLELLRQVNEES